MWEFGSPAFGAALQSSHKVWHRVTVWRGGNPVYDGLPISDGEVTMDGEQSVPGEVTFTVPAGSAGEFVPTSPFDPLAPFGQRIAVHRGIEYPGPGYETRYNGAFSSLTTEGVMQGWFVIESCDPDYLTGELKVTAKSLEKLLEDSILTQPYKPLTGGSTLMLEARRFVQGRLPIDIRLPAGVRDRATKKNAVFEGSRLSILEAIGAAWPARFRVNYFGALEVLPPVDKLPRTPVQTLRTGERGVIAKWDAPVSRDEIYNGVFARGESEAANGRLVEGYAIDLDPSSPTYWNGPFGQRPLEYSSPLLTTNAQATRAARTILKRRLRRARTVTVEMIPDPRIQLDDYVRLDTDTVKGIGRVAAYKLPLGPGTGTLTLDDMREDGT